MSKYESIPIFPTKVTGQYIDDRWVQEEIPGMTLRDWLAGQALAGMLVNGFIPNQANKPPGNTAEFDYARAAYEIATKALSWR